MACSCIFGGILACLIVGYLAAGASYNLPWFDTDTTNYLPWKACAKDPVVCFAPDFKYHTDAFKIVEILGVLASIAVFVGICASCGVCCNCCRNTVPTYVMIICALIGSLLLLIAGIAFGAMKDKVPGDYEQFGQISFGFYINFVAVVILAIVPILGCVCMKKRGDIVEYPPRIAIMVPPHNNDQRTSYPA